MKKILIFLFILIFSSCGKNENINKSNDSNLKNQSISSDSSSNEKKEKKRLEYKHVFIDGYKRDNSIFIDRM